jgi:hypothetical protein
MTTFYSNLEANATTQLFSAARPPNPPPVTRVSPFCKSPTDLGDAPGLEPGFFVEHFLKDMGIALAESRRMKLALPGLALAEQLYRAVEAQGYGRKGTQALLLALADLSRVEWPGQAQ